MKKPFPTIRYVAIILLGVTLFGFARILPVPSAYSMGAPGAVLLQAAVSPTNTQGLIEATNTPTPLIPVPTEAGSASLFAFMEAPQGPVALPYVVITAFQAGSYTGDVTISGTLNSTDTSVTVFARHLPARTKKGTPSQRHESTCSFSAA